MTKIYLVRHAEAEGNLFRRAQGQFNGMITALGYRQIEQLRHRFLPIPIDAVYASDLRRTRITSSAIWQSKGLQPQFSPLLREFSIGCWENTPWTEWAAQDPESLRAFNALDHFSAPGSETPEQVRERITGEFWRIAKENEGKTVAIVSHGMALRILMGALEGLSFEEMRAAPHGDNTAVSLIEVEGDTARIIFRDDNSHLGDLSTFAKQSWWRSKTNAPDPALRFRTLQKELQGDFLSVLRTAHSERHSSDEGFSEQQCLDAAEELLSRQDDAVRLAYWQDEVAGVVIATAENCWFYLLPALRGKRQGIQLIGEGIAVLRRHECKQIRCQCDTSALAGYLTHYGFDRNGLFCSLDFDSDL